MFKRVSLLLPLIIAAVSSALAQQYPERSVKIVVGTTAGSGPDIQARTVAQQLSSTLGQPFVVENRPGANQTIAARMVAQSEADGHTLFFVSSAIAATPYIYKNPGYDLKADLKPVASVGILDGILMLVDAKSPIKTVSEFITKAKSDRILYGSPGVGNILHLATELFSKDAGISMQHIPYKGVSEVITALLGGSVQVMFVTPPSVIGLIRDGRLRALAYTGSKPFPVFPEVPLMKNVLPGSKPLGSWAMFFAPAKTPTATIDKLNASIRSALKAPAVASIMQRDGYIPDNRDAAETAAFFDKEVDLMADAVAAAGIKPN